MSNIKVKERRHTFTFSARHSELDRIEPVQNEEETRSQFIRLAIKNEIARRQSVKRGSDAS